MQVPKEPSRLCKARGVQSYITYIRVTMANEVVGSCCLGHVCRQLHKASCTCGCKPRIPRGFCWCPPVPGILPHSRPLVLRSVVDVHAESRRLALMVTWECWLYWVLQECPWTHEHTLLKGSQAEVQPFACHGPVLLILRAGPAEAVGESCLGRGPV